MTNFQEIAEQEAVGSIAGIYDDVRRFYAAPYVSSLIRHLATRPALLEWIWSVLRPALDSGALQHSGWSRIDPGGMPGLLALSNRELRTLGVADGDVAVIGEVCQTFARVSPVNLVLAGCIRHLVLGQRPGADVTGASPGPLPDPLSAIPEMVPWEQCDAGLRATLARFETDMAGEVFVPGLYRILARWPRYLSRIADEIVPLMQDPELVDLFEQIADHIVDAAPSVLASVPVPATPPPLDREGTEAVLSAIATYRGTSPQMAVFGTMLFGQLPDYCPLGTAIMEAT